MVTNPDKDTKLRADDLVFVLAKQDPGDPDLWDEFDQRNNDMFDQKQHRLIHNINNMMLKPTGSSKNRYGSQKKNAGESADAQHSHQNVEKEHKINAQNQYSTMSNQVNNPVQLDDGEKNENMDIHMNMTLKKTQEQFDKDVDNLTKRIEDIVKKAEGVNKKLNERNNKIVENISEIIHNVLHEVHDVSQDLQTLNQTGGTIQYSDHSMYIKDLWIRKDWW